MIVLALWQVQRVEAYDDPTLGLECTDGATAHKVTMYDATTRNTQVVVLCYNPFTNDHCALLRDLEAAGFTPNDWAVECPSQEP